MIRGLVLCSLIVSVVSCTSIEEDRTGCPCWYKIDFSQVDPQIGKLYLWFFQDGDNPPLRDSLTCSEYDDIYEIELKRGTVGFHVWGNVLENTTLEFPHRSEPVLKNSGGLQVDPLYSYSRTLDTYGEEGADVVRLIREYADVEIVLKGGAVEKDGVWIKLDCGTCGRYVDGRFLEESMSLYSGTTVEGTSCKASFRVLRQKSLRDLKMSVSREASSDSYIMEDFPIGEIMLGNGYDMGGDNLQDIMVVVDVSSGKVVICTEGWETVIYVDVRL